MRLTNLQMPKWKEYAKQAFRFWLRRYKLFYFVFFLLVAALGGYQWRQSLVTYRWTPEERKAYLESTIKETVFDEALFLKTLDQRAKLDQAHAEPLVSEQSIFPGGTKKRQ